MLLDGSVSSSIVLNPYGEFRGTRSDIPISIADDELHRFVLPG